MPFEQPKFEEQFKKPPETKPEEEVKRKEIEEIKKKRCRKKNLRNLKRYIKNI